MKDARQRGKGILPKVAVLDPLRRLEQSVGLPLGSTKDTLSEMFFLQEVFNSLNVAVFLIRSSKRKIVMCNNAAERIFGFSAEEFIGQDSGIMYPNKKTYIETRKKVLPVLDAVGVFRAEQRMRRKDGSIFFSDLTIKGINDKSANRRFVVSVVRDITNQKLTLDALHESERFFQTLFQSSHDVIMLLDKAGHVVDINHRGEQLLGYPKSALLGMNAYEYLTLPADRNILQKSIHAASKGRSRSFKVRLRTIDDSIRNFSGVCGPRLYSTGEFSSAICMLRDITCQMVVEKALQVNNRRLSEMSTHLADVEETERRNLSRELHDQIGQLLAALNVNLTIIRGRIPDRLRNEIVPRIEDSLSLVEEAGSRIRSIVSELRPPILDDYGLLATLRWYGSQFASRTGVAVTVRGEEVSPRLTPSVETALFRIIQEAFNNIQKHSKAGKAEVRLTSNGKCVCLSIRDNGIGFRPSEQNAIGKVGGWGLITMSERAESLGGSIRIESRPAHGTRLVVELPR